MPGEKDMNVNLGKLRAGDWVEVKTKEEILRTLDTTAQLQGMPFMPEMFAFCGQRLQVYKRAHKTCDTVFPVRGRRVEQAVHLNTRCDGEAHGGCQAGCLIFWKEGWLKPASSEAAIHATARLEASFENSGTASTAGCTEADVWARAEIPDPLGTAPTYVCQATRLPYATTNLAWWDVRQYAEDYASGNVGLWRILCGFVYSVYSMLVQAGVGLGPPLRWVYDKFHPLWRGSLYPRRPGTIPNGQPTPSATLNLQPGELVRVKSHEEILRTLNASSKNQGLLWDAEMVPYCGRTYSVLRRVTKIVDENTGKMREMRTPCIILDSVVCESKYSYCRMFCPRSIYSFWREIWLERVGSQ